ncbi:MAG: AraC family transcriptional regulator [Clostridia bacterium]|jgi:YesN/AraC family two-component response regulator|nr:AraC family transcriptional regulator [Clostridia bacterium]
MLLYEANIDSKLIVRYMGHVTYNTPWTHFVRTADEYILYILQSGCLYMQEADTCYTLKKGDVFLLDPFIEHSGFKASCSDYYFIHFRFEGLNRLAEDAFHHLQDILKHNREYAYESSLHTYDVYNASDSLALYFPKHYSPNHLSSLFSLLEAANSSFYQKHENYRKIASLKVKEMLIHIAHDFASHLLLSSSNPPTKALSRAIETKSYLDTHYSQKITSTLLASVFDINYNYLNRTFNELTGQTIIDYLNSLRIEHAKALIASSSHLSFTDIGYLVGFDNPYYFSKIFKKYAGMTATAYAYSISFKEYK